MLKYQLLHPQILSALGCSGHGSRILIADGNYPFATGSPHTAQRVYLNLRPGVVGTKEVLVTLLGAVEVEKALGLKPREGIKAPLLDEYRELLSQEVEFEMLERFDFYDAARDGNTSLVIATGECQRFANILLTVGVVQQDH